MLKAVNLHKTYGNGFYALRGVSLSIEPGSLTGLTGESGAGKSTLARLLCCLEYPDRGHIEMDGRRYRADGPGFWGGSSSRDLKKFRMRTQIVFQDSSGSLDPRLPLWRIVAEPLENFDPRFRRASRQEKFRRVGELLERVGLDTSKARSYPHELSGGQRQRGAIARVLAVNPRYLICDEPVSSLDTESRDRIAEILVSLQKETGMGCLFISHDPALTARLCGSIYVMEEGVITETLFPQGRPCA